MVNSQKVGDQKWNFSPKIQITFTTFILMLINFNTLPLIWHINLNGFIIFCRLNKENSHTITLVAHKNVEFMNSKNPKETIGKTLVTSLTCEPLIETSI